MEEFWNERYSAKEFAFGKEPNVFFKSVIDTLKPGKILIPAAGEGRDAVYAAKLGWEVFAIDISKEGKKKALRLAADQNVQINYEVVNVRNFVCTKKFDAIALIYFHLPAEIRKIVHQNMQSCLAESGIIILEAFNKNQLRNSSGGPKELSMLMSKDELQQDFSLVKIETLSELTTELNEGLYHLGNADIIRLVGKKDSRTI